MRDFIVVHKDKQSMYIYSYSGSGSGYLQDPTDNYQGGLRGKIKPTLTAAAKCQYSTRQQQQLTTAPSSLITTVTFGFVYVYF